MSRSDPRPLAVQWAEKLRNRDLSWRTDARCHGAPHTVFFVERGASTDDARRVCRHCPVAVECLEYAVEMNEPAGIWGGLTLRERRDLRRASQARRITHDDGI